MIHSKIFIIDERIAYGGSLNFTNSGLFRNFESRVRITDPGAVKGMDDLFEDQDNKETPLNYYGRFLYTEPPN